MSTEWHEHTQESDHAIAGALFSGTGEEAIAALQAHWSALEDAWHHAAVSATEQLTPRAPFGEVDLPSYSPPGDKNALESAVGETEEFAQDWKDFDDFQNLSTNGRRSTRQAEG